MLGQMIHTRAVGADTLVRGGRPMADAAGAFCVHHTDNCERLARLESVSDATRRELVAMQATQVGQKDELMSRMDRFESTILAQNGKLIWVLGAIALASAGLSKLIDKL